ncbi:CD225/dispanin family protein [Thermoclostridium stercorarium]|uniref:CD225/dispanin family protein n=1 Tax=Thermoclostridium stercorarium TaxID=1510 RepID=UPI000A95AD51|nr:CD225/dispanin family protein [Thermoclostridium stercorarium]
MYCPKCGHEVGEHMVICPSCGELLENRNNDTVNSFSQPNYGWQQPEGMPKIQDIPDYKVQSILLIVFSAILCCVFCLPILALPFAIIALVNSNKIEAHIVAGNYEYARKVSENTKNGAGQALVYFWVQ